MPAPAVRVDGLRELRRDLRRVQPAALKEIRHVIKDAATIVAKDAATLAPRRTGALAAAMRGTTSGDKGIVRDRLPYAAVHEYGGTIRPRGGAIHIRASRMVERAIDRNRERIVDALGDGIEDAARRNGWK